MAAIFAASEAVTLLSYRADPTDDLSFGLVADARASGYRLMGAKEVERVLRDRLDLFPQSRMSELAEHIVQLSRENRFDPAFILSLIDVESSFRVKVKSPVGAVGLMQLMPTTAAVVAKKFNLRYTGKRSLEDPFTNIRLGVTYLRWLRDRFDGHGPYYHVAAYNVGPSRMRELMARADFRPRETLTYYEKIRDGVHGFRFYEIGSGKRGRVIATSDEIRTRQAAPRPAARVSHGGSGV